MAHRDTEAEAAILRHLPPDPEHPEDDDLAWIPRKVLIARASADLAPRNWFEHLFPRNRAARALHALHRQCKVCRSGSLDHGFRFARRIEQDAPAQSQTPPFKTATER